MFVIALYLVALAEFYTVEIFQTVCICLAPFGAIS